MTLATAQPPALGDRATVATQAAPHALEHVERMLGAARLSHLMAQLATEHGASSDTLRPLLDSTANLLEEMATFVDTQLRPPSSP